MDGSQEIRERETKWGNNGGALCLSLLQKYEESIGKGKIKF